MPYKITCDTNEYYTTEESEADALAKVCEDRGLTTVKEEIKKLPPEEGIKDLKLLDEMSRANRLCIYYGFTSPEAKAACMSGVIVRRALEKK